MGIARKIKYYFRRIGRIKQLELHFAATLPVTPVANKKPLRFMSSESPKVTIIIPFYNEEIYTWNCLHHLHQHLTIEIPFQIILIDDNSTEVCDFSLVEGITVIKNEQNLGFLRNINKGIVAAESEFIYILNNDTEVRAGFLTELFYVFENFKNVGAVGSKLLNSDGTLQEAGSLFMRNMDIRQIVRDKEVYFPDVNYIRKVDYCSGCSLLFRRHKDNGEINLLDDQFAPAYFEETDFCFDLKYNQKKEIYYTPFSEVLHFNGVTYNSSKTKDELKENKKEALFKANREKFKNKWAVQIESIKAPKVEDRIEEIYGKSVIIYTDRIPEHDKDSGSNRLREIINAFIGLNYHVLLIVKNTYVENPYVKHYQKLGVNVFYEYQRYTGYKSYLKNQKVRPEKAWFYGPRVFRDYVSITQRLFPFVKLVYDMVDIHHLRYERAIVLEPNRISLRKRFRNYKKMELKAAAIADYVIAISDNEAQYMKSFCDASKIVTISNIHYPKVDLAKTLKFEDRKDILFIGSKHTPNIDAIKYLYERIMPVVWSEIPEMKVHIIGDVVSEIQDIEHQNFIFHGYVPDITTFFISSKMMVAPLRYGAGVKGKIGQAFEYFLPVVTSSIGAEGMRLTNNVNAIIDDTDVGFAKAIIQVYSDKALWQKLQDNSEKSLEPFSKEELKKQIVDNIT